MVDPHKPGFIRRFFRGLWNALNFTRRLVFNLGFLLLLLVFVGAMFGSVPKLAPRTALVVDPKGELVEQYRSNPADRALGRMLGNEPKEVQMRDLVRVFEAAAKDPDIERVVLIPDELDGAGLASLTELGAAIERVRGAGKEVIAVSKGMNQLQYLFAAHADRILLHPDGGVLLEGFSAYRSYYKDLLDKLAVQVHLFRVGEFKSAAEPYILNQASPEAREADRFWLGSLWQTYLNEVGARRKLDPKALQASIESLPESIDAVGGDLSKLALGANLVDELATRDQARQMLMARGEQDADGRTFRQVNWKDYLARLHAAAIADTRPVVAVVVAEGEIVGGERQPGTVGGDSTADLLRQAREDDGISSVVLRVNSPGGEVFASEQIRREVELTRAAGKPVVVSMGDVAASGGYWISMNADRIFAEPGTITGSIGIFGMFINIPDTLAKIGVHTDGVGTTSFAGAFDARRPLDPRVGAIIQSVIDKGYRDFIGRVATARGKTIEEIDEIARGRVWSGSQARERGLVDQLGGLADAAADAAHRAKIGANFQLRYLEKPLNPFDRLLLSLGESAMTRAFAKLGLPHALLADADLRRTLHVFDGLAAGKPTVFAYCFCEVR